MAGVALADPAVDKTAAANQIDQTALGERSAAVKAALARANGLQNLGDLDKADLQLQDVLRTDPQNGAARRAMERGEQLRSPYYDAARDHQRARAISATAAMWEDAVPAVDLSHLFGSAGQESRMAGSNRASIQQKLRTLIVPLADFDSVSLVEVVEFLRIRSRDLDPAKKGVGFILHASPEIESRTLTLRMSSVPLEEVLRQATSLTGADYRVDEHAVIITSLQDKQEALISRQYRVPPDFLQTTPVAAAGGGLPTGRLGALELLQQRGVPFPDGATASYTPATNVLFVRNTATNMMLVDSLVDQAVNATAKQVEIQIRMVEVSDARVKELGIDWLLGQFNVPGSEKIFASGGGQSVPGEVLPFAGRTVTDGLRSATEVLGLRSSGTRIGRALVPGADAKSPGAFAVSGVLTDPQFQGVLRGLNQSKGIDVMATPTLFTKSGQRAALKMVKEFRYPKEYDAPETPTRTTGGGLGKPSSPRSFEKRDVGIVFEVEPVIGQNKVIELSLSPSFLEFEGFIDYGQDFQNSTTDRLTGQPVYFTVENQILQPIFRANRISTAVSIWDGCTVVLGGAAFEKRFRADDKVPVVGDLPLIGRTFQSKVKQVERTNVLFFVTARIVDPGGNGVATAAVSNAP
ncbi:type II secretion system protein GspD [Verrucomicrobium spinosum]|uniref:type II secretion system protein GspD n=1 Tax=Verrucomicrobium spinosum TaxID=2736 RepID=UPI0001744EDD|nr:fimbrial assembly protein [Verrucomicrobium spinosum]